MTTKPVTLSEKSKPRILGDELVKKYATVRRDAITIHITSTQYIHRTIYFTEVAKFGGLSEEWKHECGDEALVVPLDEEQRGSKFTFRVLSRDIKSGLVVEHFKFVVKAELTKTEMKAFLEHILKRINKFRMEPGYLYRNFTKEDEERIKATNNGYFEMNLKQRSGHRSSPLYRKLDNVTYYSCKLFRKERDDKQLKYLPEGYKFPHFSPFGDQRVAYKASTLLNDDCLLFLCGMHCYGFAVTRAHYVTLAICQKGSLAYHTLIELGCIVLPWTDNPIFTWDKKSGAIKCASKLIRERAQTGDRVYPHDVWVEIIFCDTPASLSQGKRSTCDHRDYSSEHKSNTDCESCHGQSPSTDESNENTPESSPLKRRSLEENCAVPEKALKKISD